MRIKNKIILIVFGVIGAICLYFLAYYASKLFKKSSEQTHYYSAMSWLSAAICEELDDYYIAKGRYPPQLSDLSIPFPGDGAKPEMLDNFKYVTDGNSYEITWSIQWGSGTNIHKEHIVKGKISYTEYYVNGQLFNKNEYPEGMEISKSRFKDRNSVQKYRGD